MRFVEPIWVTGQSRIHPDVLDTRIRDFALIAIADDVNGVYED